MGCASPRSPAEEKTIQTESVLTGFEAVTASAAAHVIRSHSTAKFILSTHFKAIKRELNLNKKPEDQEILKALYDRLSSTEESDRSRVLAAYPRLSQEDLSNETLIHEEQLTVLAALLSRSSPREKAFAIFRAFDDGLGNRLTEPTANEMFRVAFKLALEDLPLLQKHASDEVNKYLEKGKRNYIKAITEAVAVAIANRKNASATEFANAVSKHLEGKLTSAAGLRELAVGKLDTELEAADKEKTVVTAGQPRETAHEPEKPAEVQADSAPAEEEKQA